MRIELIKMGCVGGMILLGHTFFSPLRAVDVGTESPKPIEISVEQLDAQLAKERLRKVYGEFNLKLGGEWQVTVDGRTEKWRWNPEKVAWICPADQKARCAELVPIAFKWWGRGRGWMQEWSPEKRQNLEFGKVRTESSLERAGTGSGEEDPTTGEVKTFEGKKTADEIWIWKSGSGAEAKLAISLRDQRVDQIESRDGVEHLEWFQKQPGSALELSKLTFEHSGAIVTLSRVRS